MHPAARAASIHLLLLLQLVAGGEPALAGRLVAVTIDDFPSSGPRTRPIVQNVKLLVEHVKSAGAPAVGFVVGRRGGLGAMAPWIRAGLQLANHTYSHRPYTRLGIEEYLADIRKNELAVRRALGVELRGTYFRYPFLDHGSSSAKIDAVARYLKRARYRLAPVSLDTIDYRFADHYGSARDRRSRRAIARLYLRHIQQAAGHFERLSRRLYRREIPLILLVHANELNADHLGGVLRVLVRRGYRFATLARVLDDRAYKGYGSRPPVVKIRSDRNFLNQVAVSRGIRVPDPTGDAHFDRVWRPRLSTTAKSR
jgi:peptidoglycan/xylan/chitin deacetylase (PgdA/CDA1 family)